MTFEQSFLVEEVLDALIPAEQNRVAIIASTKRFSGVQKMWWFGADEYGNGANYYMRHDIPVWIGSFDQFIFGREESDPPKNIWFAVS